MMIYIVYLNIYLKKHVLKHLKNWLALCENDVENNYMNTE